MLNVVANQSSGIHLIPAGILMFPYYLCMQSSNHQFWDDTEIEFTAAALTFCERYIIPLRADFLSNSFKLILKC